MAGLAKSAAGRPPSCAVLLQSGKKLPVVNKMRLWPHILCILRKVLIVWIRPTLDERHCAAARAAFERKDWKVALDEAFKADFVYPDIAEHIANCYAKGLGVAKDEAKAEKWASSSLFHSLISTHDV